MLISVIQFASYNSPLNQSQTSFQRSLNQLGLSLQILAWKMKFFPFSCLLRRAQQGTASTVLQKGRLKVFMCYYLFGLWMRPFPSIFLLDLISIIINITTHHINFILDYSPEFIIFIKEQLIQTVDVISVPNINKMEELKQKPKETVHPISVSGKEQLRANQCLHALLGEKVDLVWHLESGILDVTPSKSQQFKHTIQGKVQTFEGIPFRHSEKCPLLNPELTKNQIAVVKPCVVVLIQNKDSKKILATQRHQTMSFGGKWVLPGGHLQPNQNLLVGGLRECQEEVGFKGKKEILSNQGHNLMLWESVLVDQKNKKIKRAALVVFLKVESDHFQVVEQKSEVKAWEWRSFQTEEYPWGGGWAEGHLSYLSHISKAVNF